MRNLREDRRGVVLIIMAVTLMAILMIAALGSAKSFRPSPKDPEAYIITIKSQVRRAALNSLAIASRTGDTNLTESLQEQLRNIAAAQLGTSIGIYGTPQLQITQSQNYGISAVKVTFQIVQAQYILLGTADRPWLEDASQELRLQIIDGSLSRQDRQQFTSLSMNVTLLLNGGAALIDSASVAVDSTSYPCEVRNFGDGTYRITLTVPYQSSINATLYITDRNGIRVACKFTA